MPPELRCSWLRRLWRPLRHLRTRRKRLGRSAQLRMRLGGSSMQQQQSQTTVRVALYLFQLFHIFYMFYMFYMLKAPALERCATALALAATAGW